MLDSYIARFVSDSAVNFNISARVRGNSWDPSSMTHLIRGVLIRGVIVAAGNFITPRIKKMLVLKRFREILLIRVV